MAGAFALALLALSPPTLVGLVTDRTVLSDPKYDASQQAMAVAPSGGALVAWREKRDGDWVVRAAVRATSGEWSPAETLSAPGGDAEDLQVAVGGDGTPAVAWQRVEGPLTAAQVAVRPAGGAWTPVKTLSAPTVDGFNTRIGVDGKGNVTAVWTSSDGRNLILQSAARTAGADWGASADVSEPGRSAFDPQLVVESEGAAVALWRRSDGASSLVQTAFRPAAGPWAPPENLSGRGGNALEPRLVVTGQGLVVAGWRRFNGRVFVVQAASRTAVRGWSRPRDVSRRSSAIRLSVVATGKIAVMEWFEGRSAVRGVVAENGDVLAPKETSSFQGPVQRAVDNTGGLFRSTAGATFFPATVNYTASGKAEGDLVGYLGAPCVEDEDEFSVTCVATSLAELVAVGEGRVLALYLAQTDERDTLEVATVNSVPLPTEPDPELDEPGGEEDPSLDEPLDEESLDARSASLVVGKTGLVTVPVRCGRRLSCEGRVMLRVVLPTAPKGGQRQAARPFVVAAARFRMDAGAQWGVTMRVSPRMRALLVYPRGARAVLVFRAAPRGGRVVTQRRIVTLTTGRSVSG